MARIALQNIDEKFNFFQSHVIPAFPLQNNYFLKLDQVGKSGLSKQNSPTDTFAHHAFFRTV